MQTLFMLHGMKNKSSYLIETLPLLFSRLTTGKIEKEYSAHATTVIFIRLKKLV